MRRLLFRGRRPRPPRTSSTVPSTRLRGRRPWPSGARRRPSPHRPEGGCPMPPVVGARMSPQRQRCRPRPLTGPHRASLCCLLPSRTRWPSPSRPPSLPPGRCCPAAAPRRRRPDRGCRWRRRSLPQHRRRRPPPHPHPRVWPPPQAGSPAPGSSVASGPVGRPPRRPSRRRCCAPCRRSRTPRRPSSLSSSRPRRRPCPTCRGVTCRSVIQVGASRRQSTCRQRPPQAST